MRIWDSPRRRKRVIRWSALVLAIPIVFLALHFSSPGDPGNANGPVIPNYVQPKRSPFTAAEKQAVHPVLADFIRHAVARQDPGKAWDLAGPDLREGSTEKQWEKGDMPVVPYPAADKGLGEWSYVKYSYTDTVGLEVFVFPKPGSGYSAMTADAEVVKDDKGKWFVELLAAGEVPRSAGAVGGAEDCREESGGRSGEEGEDAPRGRSRPAAASAVDPHEGALAARPARAHLADHPRTRWR